MFIFECVLLFCFATRAGFLFFCVAGFLLVVLHLVLSTIGRIARGKFLRYWSMKNVVEFGRNVDAWRIAFGTLGGRNLG